MRSAIVALVLEGATPAQARFASAFTGSRGNIVDLLIHAGFPPAAVLDAAAKVTRLPVAPAAWLRDPRPPEVAGIDPALCRQLGAAPVASVAGQLCVVFSDPELAAGSDTLGLPAHRAYLALPADVARALARLAASSPEASTIAQNTLDAATVPRFAPTRRPAPEDTQQTAAMDARRIDALSRLTRAEDPFLEPTEPALAAAQREPAPFAAPPPTVSDATHQPPRPAALAELAARGPPRTVADAPETRPAVAQHAPVSAAARALDEAARDAALLWDPSNDPASVEQASPLPPAAPPPPPAALPPLVATSAELSDALSAALRAADGARARAPSPQPSPPGTESFGAPTLLRDTRREAREYLEENPPTILEKGPQGTMVERARPLQVLPLPTASPEQALAPTNGPSAWRIAVVLGALGALALLIWNLLR